MSATKRKFNALLQGLGDNRSASSTSPNATDSTTDAILQKRRRLGFPPSTAPSLDPPSFSLSASSPTSRPRRAQASAGSAPKPAVKYCPTDRDELLRRLETFQDITKWTPKPDRLSEVEWAKKGWVCHGKETVRCVLCSKELVIKLARRSSEAEGEGEDSQSSSIGRSPPSPAVLYQHALWPLTDYIAQRPWWTSTLS